MTVRYILKCYNDSCENFGGFVNEPEFDFEDEAQEEAWSEAYGRGSEDVEDYCPFCGQLATMEDIIEIIKDITDVTNS